MLLYDQRTFRKRQPRCTPGHACFPPFCNTLPDLKFSRMNYPVPAFIFCISNFFILFYHADDRPHYQHYQYHFHFDPFFIGHKKSPDIFNVTGLFVEVYYTLSFKPRSYFIIIIFILTHRKPTTRRHITMAYG